MRILTVSQVRERLYWSAGGPRAGGPGTRSIALLGQLFHNLYGVLTGSDASLNFVRPLELADASPQSWRKSLVDHAFVSVISPALAKHEAVLESQGGEVAGFWAAVRELCAWLADILYELRTAAPERSLQAWHEEIFAGTEVELSVEVNDPAWPEPILLQGRADAMLIRPRDAQRCLVELKLGRTSPEADLLQGVLYHLMLTEGELARGGSALAMVSFQPQRHERVFEADTLQGAQSALKEVLAELAEFRRPAGFRNPPRGPRPPAPSVIAAPPAEAVKELKRRLSAAFAEYGAPITIADEYLAGPAFIRFFAAPQRGVLAKRIAALAPNVWMRLGTGKPPQVSLEAGRVVIDVQRTDRQQVSFSDWRVALAGQAAGGGAAFAVGVRVDGTLHMADLAESQSPHLLVVGTTGSGKSEWLRAFLASLMATNTPRTLRFVLIDPKRLTFSLFEHSAFLEQDIVYDEGAIDVLDELVDKMESRYKLLQAAGVDDIAAYNARQSAAPLARIVCVCDEFADLIMRDKKSRTAIEERVSRLGAKGRAAGIHLVFATQRAGREVLKGTIDSNLPARVALAVPRSIDSRMVLEEAGAENLLGQGDLFYKDIGNPVRLQGLRVTKVELERLANAIDVASTSGKTAA